MGQKFNTSTLNLNKFLKSFTTTNPDKEKKTLKLIIKIRKFHS